MQRHTQPVAIGSSIARCATAFAGVALVNSCAVGPSYQRPPVVIPDTWQAPASERISTLRAETGKWWEAFHDEALARLIDVAVRQNLSLQVAGLRIVEARAQLSLAGATQFPILAVSGSATAIGLSGNIPYVARVPDDQRRYFDFQAGFDAAWEADLWGKYRRAVEAEKASLAAAEADQRFALVSLTAEVARTYTVLRTYEELIRQAQENTTLQEESLAIAESRLRNGATSELDVAQARALLESTRASLPQLQASLAGSTNALSTLLGQPSSQLQTLLAGPQEIPAAPANVPIGVPAEMLRRRPDIESAEARAHAAAARVGVAEAELYPLLALTGSIGYETTTATGVATNFGNGLYYSVGPRILWRALDFGRSRSGVRIADARYQQLLVEYENAVLRAKQEVEDALASFQNAEGAIAFAREAVTSSRRAVDIAVTQYREGAADYQRVLDAQRSLLEQENNLSQLRSTSATSLVALYKALGGGWQSWQALPVVSEDIQADMKKRTDWGNLVSQPVELKSDETTRDEGNPSKSATEAQP